MDIGAQALLTELTNRVERKLPADNTYQETIKWDEEGVNIEDFDHLRYEEGVNAENIVILRISKRG